MWSQLLITATVTTKVQMPLHREIQGLCFYTWFVRQIMNCTLSYLYVMQIHVFSVGQETMAVDKIFKLISGTKLKGCN